MRANLEVITSPMISPWIATDSVDTATDRCGSEVVVHGRLLLADSSLSRGMTIGHKQPLEGVYETRGDSG